MLRPDVSHEKTDKLTPKILIKEAARTLFQENGMREASVRDVAKKAGYTTGAVYFHFKDKDAIYFEILEEALNSLVAQVKQAAEGKNDPFSALISAYLAFYRFYDEKPAELMALLNRTHKSELKSAGGTLDATINAQFGQIKGCFIGSLVRFGAEEKAAEEEAAVLLSDLIGLIVSSTGKNGIMVGIPSDVLLNRHLERLQGRLMFLKNSDH